MKLFKKNITLSISTIILFSTLSVSAYASTYNLYGHGYSTNYSSGRHSNHYNKGYHRYNHGHHYSSRRRHNYGHHNSYGPTHSYYQNKRHNSYRSKPCHKVSKTIVDEYGEYQKIGGTMCYDSYGQGYVVSGSRYNIR